jgi:hypothetical protein
MGRKKLCWTIKKGDEKSCKKRVLFKVILENGNQTFVMGDSINTDGDRQLFISKDQIAIAVFKNWSHVFPVEKFESECVPVENITF